jgi:hypothetical protein
VHATAAIDAIEQVLFYAVHGCIVDDASAVCVQLGRVGVLGSIRATCRGMIHESPI